MLKAKSVRNIALHFVLLTFVLVPSTFAGVITSTYSGENQKFEFGSSTSLMWSAGFDLGSFLAPAVKANPLLSQEFAAASATVDRGIRFISELKTELVSRILEEGLGK